MKKYPCIESTLDLKLGDYIVRLWIEEEELEAEYPNKRILGELMGFVWENKPTLKEMVEHIHQSIPRVNAVQIKNNADEHGVMVYFVDF